MEKNDFFSEDDQAPLINVLANKFPAFFREENKDGKPTISHSFQIIDFSMKDIGKQRKHIYPEVMVLIEGWMPDKFSSVKLETYIRLKYRKKYYLCKVYKDSIIPSDSTREQELIVLMKHFYSEVYRYQQLMKVDLKMVIGHYDPPVPVFELDPDQTEEEKRLISKI